MAFVLAPLRPTTIIGQVSSDFSLFSRLAVSSQLPGKLNKFFFVNGDNGSWLGMGLTDTFCRSLFNLLAGSFAKLALRFDKSNLSDFLFYRLYFGGDVVLDEMRGLGLLLLGAGGYSAEPGQSIVKIFFPLLTYLCASQK